MKQSEFENKKFILKKSAFQVKNDRYLIESLDIPIQANHNPKFKLRNMPIYESHKDLQMKKLRETSLDVRNSAVTKSTTLHDSSNYLGSKSVLKSSSNLHSKVGSKLITRDVNNSQVALSSIKLKPYEATTNMITDSSRNSETRNLPNAYTDVLPDLFTQRYNNKLSVLQSTPLSETNRKTQKNFQNVQIQSVFGKEGRSLESMASKSRQSNLDPNFYENQRLISVSQQKSGVIDGQTWHGSMSQYLAPGKSDISRMSRNYSNVAKSVNTIQKQSPNRLPDSLLESMTGSNKVVRDKIIDTFPQKQKDKNLTSKLSKQVKKETFQSVQNYRRSIMDAYTDKVRLQVKSQSRSPLNQSFEKPSRNPLLNDLDDKLRRLAKKKGMQNVHYNDISIKDNDWSSDWDESPESRLLQKTNGFGGNSRENLNQEPDFELKVLKKGQPIVKDLKYSKEFNEAINRGVNIYMTRGFVENRTESPVLKSEIPNWDTARNSQRIDMSVKIFTDSLNDVSMNIFKGYVYEIEELKKHQTKDFDQFKAELKDYMGFKSDEEVYSYLIKEANKESKERAFKNILYKKNYASQNKIPEKVMKDVKTLDPEELRELINLEVGPLPLSKYTTENSLDNTLEQLMKRKDVKDNLVRADRYGEIRDEYQITKTQEYEKIQRANSLQNLRLISMYEPNQRVSKEDVVDENIDELLYSSDAFKNMEKQYERNAYMQEIRQQAQEITNGITARAEDAVQKDLNLMKIKKLLGGQKTDYLIYKFITILRDNVSKKKTQFQEKNNDKLVQKLYDKVIYSKEFMQKPLEDTKRSRKQTREQKQKALEDIKRQQLSKSNYDFKKTINEQEKEKIGEMTVRQFVQTSLLKNKGVPLPLLQMIKPDGFFPLTDYKLNPESLKALMEIFGQLVPSQVTKLYLINNKMDDQQLGSMLKEFDKVLPGIQVICLMQNQIGQQTIETLTEYIPQIQLSKLKKFILKDPVPYKKLNRYMTPLVRSLAESSLNQLTRLSLVRLGFNNDTIEMMSQAVRNLGRLQYLDISGNQISAPKLSQFLQKLMEQSHKLRYLNISFNGGLQEEAKELELSPKQQDAKNLLNKLGGNVNVSRLEYSIAHFIHKSECLVHLDISSLPISVKSYLYIAKYGLRKSRTLLSCHMESVGFLQDEIKQMRKYLKIRTATEIRDSFNDPNIKKEITIDKKLFLSTFSNKLKDASEVAEAQNQRSEQNLVIRSKQKSKQTIINTIQGDRLILKRDLGRPEIIGSHRWVEDTSSGCHVTGKYTYTVIVWNRRLAKNGMNSRFFNHSSIGMPVKCQHIVGPEELSHPVLAFKDGTVVMPTMKEVFERLNSRKLRASQTVRPCDNEIEAKYKQDLTHTLTEKIDKYGGHDSTWTDWDCIMKVCNEEDRPRIEFDSDCVNNWADRLTYLFPKNAFQVIPLDSFQKYLEAVYKDFKPNVRNKLISTETFISCMHLPDSFVASDSGELQFLIQDRMVNGVDYLKVKVPRCKHLSVNTMSILQKQVKKVKEIRHFSKPRSVFAKWQEDTKKVIDKAFDTDKELTKLKKFIKDESDLAATFKVFRDCYGSLKNQFNTQIATVKSYPVIDWLDFVEYCSKVWKVLDVDLTSSDVDRIFLATNFEEQDLEENDDNSLCRFEFMEIIARLAREKYYVKGAEPTISKSCKRLLDNFVLKNSSEVMPWQEFRNNELWCLAVDDIFKANLQSISTLFNKFGTQNWKGKRVMSKDEITSMVEQASDLADPTKLGLDPKFMDFNDKDIQRKVVYAYSLAKMTISDEMADFDNYNRMQIFEFYEFIARFGHLLCDNTTKQSEPLVWKIEMVLRLLIPQLTGQEVFLHQDDDNLPSDSDYEEDIIDEFLQK